MALQAAFDGMTGPEVVNALFPDGQDWAAAMREAADTLVQEDDDVRAVHDKLRGGITQPELPQSGDYVRIMSLHKSKGLTSRIVIVAGCVLGLIPFVDRRLAIAEQETLEQEQRRLFYVAITRPTERLILSSARVIDPAFAYRLGALIHPNGLALASLFLGELGQHAPQAIRGDLWIERGFE